MKRSIVAAAIVATVVGGSSATAARLISGKDIRDGSITARDIREGGITLNRLTPGAQALLRNKASNSFTGNSQSAPVKGDKGDKGDTGATGPQGPKGDTGAQGPAGDTASSANWGIINRNTLGSPDQELRSGPGVPPNGKGSLNLAVQAAPEFPSSAQQEKAAFGNEIDFAGNLVSDITAIGFWIYNTGEDNSRGTPNTPSITLEIDPNLAATPSNFSSLVFTPATNPPANQWSPFIDATSAAAGTWFLTGAAGTATGCLIGTPCSFTALQTALADGGDAATVLSVAITKGRDFSYQGAVDGLRINDRLFDFEEKGVNERGAK